MPDVDLIQLAREAIVAILDTDVDVIAITGRAANNIVPWEEPETEAAPIGIAFMFSAWPRLGGAGEGYRIAVQFACIGATEAEANALVALIPEKLSPLAFQSLPTPLDAWVDSATGRGPGEDDRSDLDLSLITYRPTSVGV